MTDKNCNDCYYGDQCPNCYVCKYFTPITDSAEDEVIYDEVECGRNEFLDEWNQYIYQCVTNNTIHYEGG